MKKWQYLFVLIYTFSMLSAVSAFAQKENKKALRGTASFYANKFEGRKTTSGEKYRKDSLTAAHKTLPFGTRVRVTNLNNNKSVVVKINDRLPKKSKRVIDLSRAAATELDFIRQGLTKVEIEVVE
jgi:rare lipoprotein A